MNYKRTNYVTFKNYWQPPDIKENFFVKYAIRGPITVPNDNYDFEFQNLKKCGIC